MQILESGLRGLTNAPPANLMHTCSNALGRTHTGKENLMARQLHYLALLINKHAAANRKTAVQPVLDLQSSHSLKTAWDLSRMMNMPASFQGKETCPGKIHDKDDWITRGIDADGNDLS